MRYARNFVRVLRDTAPMTKPPNIFAIARALPLNPYGWRPVCPGVSRLEVRAPNGTELTLELHEGAPEAPGIAVWLLQERTAFIIRAAQA